MSFQSKALLSLCQYSSTYLYITLFSGTYTRIGLYNLQPTRSRYTPFFHNFLCGILTVTVDLFPVCTTHISFRALGWASVAIDLTIISKELIFYYTHLDLNSRMRAHHYRAITTSPPAQRSPMVYDVYSVSPPPLSLLPRPYGRQGGHSARPLN